MSKHDDLRPENYGTIRHAMLEIAPDLPSALDDMSTRQLCLPHYPDRVLPLDRYDTSFSRQIWDAFKAPEHYPDVVIGTVNSGIPPIDAVDSFCKERGIKSPVFLPLRINQWFAFQYYSNDIFSVGAQLKAHRLAHQLKATLSGAKVVVIEEWVRSGNCIEICGEIAKKAGAISVMGMRGRWYDNAYRKDINLRDMTSIHAPFMREIGQVAATRNPYDANDAVQ